MATFGKAHMNADEAPRARDIFIFWEKWLRPSYNILLVLACVAAAALLATPGQPVPFNWSLAFHLISWAIAANILFTAGPFADFYVSVLLRRRVPAVTAIIFGAGALASLPVVLICLSRFWATQYGGDWLFGGFD